MTMQPAQQPTIQATPVVVGQNNNGVIPGTRAAQLAQSRAPASAEAIRRASADEDEYLEEVEYANQGVNGYLEPVSIGGNPQDLWARTYVKDFDEADDMALDIALETDWEDERWAGTIFHRQDVGTNAINIRLALRKSVGRMSLWEALMGQVGMIAPEIMRSINGNRSAFRNNEPNYR